MDTICSVKLKKHRQYAVKSAFRGLPSLLLTCIIQKKVSSSGLQNLLPSDENEGVSCGDGQSFVLNSVTPGDKENEAGALLFRIAWLFRKQGIEPELALRRFTIDFMDRIHRFEIRLEENGMHLSDVAPEKLTQLWNEYQSEDR